MTIVVDADIACSAGGQAGKSICCTEILKAINDEGFHIHFGPILRDEWFRNMSAYARTWYVTMRARNRLDLREAEECQLLGEHLRSLPLSHNHSGIMRRDRHLVDAALVRDFRIVSGDKKARNAFRTTALPAVPLLESIYWAQADDGSAGEACIQWLRGGAPDDETLMLHCEIN